MSRKLVSKETEQFTGSTFFVKIRAVNYLFLNVRVTNLQSISFNKLDSKNEAPSCLLTTFECLATIDYIAYFDLNEFLYNLWIRSVVVKEVLINKPSVKELYLILLSKYSNIDA